MDDVQTYLEEQDKDLLVRIVIQQAMEDELQRERLLLRASRMGGLDLFHLIVPLRVEVDEVAVGATVDRPAHDPDLVLAIHEIAVLTERDVRRSTQPQILLAEGRTR